MARHSFKVSFGARTASFSHSEDAQLFAQWMAETQHLVTEVYLTAGKGRGIIGQYHHNGLPTAEFRGRGDEVYPAGTLADTTAFRQQFAS